MPEIDTFKSVATRYRGKIYTGRNHLLIFDEIRKQHPDAREEDCVTGFLMTSGKLVDRYEAKPIAVEQRVLRPGHTAWISPDLHSEDLVFGTLS